MTSNMMRTKRIRLAKKNSGGKARKAKARTQGSTKSAKALFAD